MPALLANDFCQVCTKKLLVRDVITNSAAILVRFLDAPVQVIAVIGSVRAVLVEMNRRGSRPISRELQWSNGLAW